MTPRNTNDKKKRFDCVEMMHKGAAFVRKELEGKTVEEQIAYWDTHTKALLARQAELRKAQSQARG